MLKSKSKMIKPISLPEYKGDQVYMHEFDMANPSLPVGCERWNSVLKEIISNSPKQTGKAYITIDEKIVRAGESHRRGGPHTDGNYLFGWGGGGGGLVGCLFWARTAVGIRIAPASSARRGRLTGRPPGPAPPHAAGCPPHRLPAPAGGRAVPPLSAGGRWRRWWCRAGGAAAAHRHAPRTPDPGWRSLRPGTAPISRLRVEGNKAAQTHRRENKLQASSAEHEQGKPARV